jgi:hypothetical protein
MADTKQKEAERVPVDPSLLDWAEYWYPISWKVVIAGGVITALGLLLQYRTTTIREEQSAWRTSILESDNLKAQAALETAQADIARANAKIADANALQKEAELRLEQLRRQVAPRVLNREAFIKALEGEVKAPTEVMFLRDDSESMGLAQGIAFAMEAAGWQITSRRPIPPSADPQLPTAMTVGGQPSGVTVVVSSITRDEADASLNAMRGQDWVKTPWTVLSHAIGVGLGQVGSSAGGPNAPPVGTLRIVVAPRI